MQIASLSVLPSMSWSTSRHDGTYAGEQGGRGTREGTTEPLRKAGAHPRAALHIPRRYVQHTPDVPAAPDPRQRSAAHAYFQVAATTTRRGHPSRGADIPPAAGGWALRRASCVCVAVRRSAGAVLVVLRGCGWVAARMVRRG